MMPCPSVYQPAPSFGPAAISDIVRNYVSYVGHHGKVVVKIKQVSKLKSIISTLQIVGLATFVPVLISSIMSGLLRTYDIRHHNHYYYDDDYRVFFHQWQWKAYLLFCVHARSRAKRDHIRSVCCFMC